MRREDLLKHNRAAWNHSVNSNVRWTQIAGQDLIDRARSGDVEIILTPQKKVPASWLQPLAGRRVLGLAAGGGQQGPVLAAAGALVTIVDLSPLQLQQDNKAAEQYGLNIQCIEASADDLTGIPDSSQDLIVHPVSNCFFPQLESVWRECYRVLKPDGELIAGINNPVAYLFDYEKSNRGEFILKYAQPFSDIESFTSEEKARFLRPESPLEFGHSLESQLGQLMRQGFVLLDLYEDYWGDANERPIDRYFPQFIAYRAKKQKPSGT